MPKITKALIPAAGFGTRFLPQTKAMPKEMMPLVDKPIIQRVVEELVEAGIETIVIVTGLYKRSIEDHFDNLFELEDKLAKAGKEKELETVKKISDMAQFVYIRQKGPPGTGTTILNSKVIMGDDPFMVFWGDDFIDAEPSRAKQLIAAYEKYGATILGGLRLDKDDDYKKYGYAAGKSLEPGIIKLSSIIEKPGTREKSPSDLAILSGFIFTPDIYEPLEKARENLPEGKELLYVDGVQGLLKENKPVYAVELKNALYRDTGNKFEYLKTVMEYGLKHPEFGKDFEEHFRKKLNS